MPENINKNINLQIAIDYAKAVLNDEIKACKYIKKACQNFLDFLDDDRYYYNYEAVDNVIEFISNLELTESSAGKPFILENWQVFIICNIYGLYYNNTNKRKHKYIYIEVPRKNGKSMLINALALYHLLFDVDSQVVVSANSREQAKNVNFKQCKVYCSQLDRKQKQIKQQYSKIKYKNNELIVTASDAKKLDGLNCSVAIVDELHEAKNSAMYDVLKSSQGARVNPLLLVITTAGFDTTSFCYQLRDYNLQVLEGKKTDDSQLTIIYSLDDDDDIANPENWKKANPNISISVYEDFIQSEVNKALNNPVEAHSVRVKNFNLWLQNKQKENKYAELDFINKASSSIDINNELFENFDCFAGVDLAAVSDITAVSYMIQLDDKFYFFNKYYLPEFSLNSNTNKLMYRKFANEGYITLTQGNVTDYDYILADILEVNKTHNINTLSYDNWNATQFAINATEAGLYLKPFSQSTQSINKPAKEFLRLLYSDRIIIDYNPVTLWMFNNCIIKEYGENIRIDKAKKHEKIDGIAAMLNCLGGYLNNPISNLNVF